jgi:hypothetical protein
MFVSFPDFLRFETKKILSRVLFYESVGFGQTNIFFFMANFCKFVLTKFQVKITSQILKIEIKTDSFQQTLSFWKHKNMARSISWSVWRRFLSEENWWNLCDCLRLIGTLVWAWFGGTNPRLKNISVCPNPTHHSEVWVGR